MPTRTTSGAACFPGRPAGDWGFLTYQDDDDTLLIFGNGLDPVQLWNGETPPGQRAAGRARQGPLLRPAL